MQARGPLMIEHRLIEKMIAILRKTLAKIETGGGVDPLFIDAAVDFIRMYADRTHHGKEEEIMFRDLGRKAMSEADRRLMEDLIAEHVLGRKTTKELVEANARYRRGDAAALAVVAGRLRTLADFYPRHIEKEDRIFFPACRAYMTEEEDRAMLAEFFAFDRMMIHEKYQAVVKALAGN
ncbi:MAG TPA: hemerythrin domain-containing protein [Syntrophales bacterium]|nr:hemerythrin domain-containing protein [Syntrophales bacterium]